ncbi:assimilatory sulfite reductase (NADPH) flavoprotein subunit [Halobacillus salinarum]|uniref:Assimilatory sulfite reductase (NADPH) flavoprotein subunit n=1 Tax=Halobacillus salinarum TaxID=2932257 RepID=A0ABY4EED4_9BACI|nr:assimilatory sulfite reductase (NADPH) flavoprotein subunit [Halobacillus salinarum]UOQ42825.1 assimilatory sulfite reductase (NADPH) flavoprotein subunit [Halobacillus salinarum]
MFQVENSPFNQEQTELLNRLLPTLTETQKTWLSGYLAAGQSAAPVQEAPQNAQAADAPKSSPTREITILVGSHTGNCQALAEEFSQKLEQKNFKVSVSSMDDFKPKALKKVEDLLILTSTHGDGDPPDNAIGFYDFLHSKRAPKLDDVRFSVLALGDSSYEFYCQTGKDFDKRLEELGAARIHPRVDCDLDFEEPANEWFEGVLNELNEGQSDEAAPAQAAQPDNPVAAEQEVYSRTNPFRAEILENLNLNGRGSNKETRHLELDLEGSNLVFEPGDSIGIFPENDPVLVDELIKEMAWNGDEKISINKQGEQRPLKDVLTTMYEITSLTKPLLEKIGGLTGSDELQELAADRERVKEYIHGRDLIDLVREFGPWKVPAQEFINVLRKIPVRLYSIASSSKANPDEVHLTVGALRYESNGRGRKGVCSGQCAERTQAGDTLPIFVQRNQNFRLPENDEAPVIMIGAGTGVAPYRAFLEEREESGSKGQTWLFFGEQHFVSDFLYQIEWQRWLKDGILTKMDVAFSRDTEEKIYVQHRMMEQSEELYKWLEAGAHVYVCGDEKYMAKDVQDTLIQIIKKEGNMSGEEAEAYLNDLRSEKRYQRDVY